MKKKFRLHAEVVEILNKPGRYVVLKQWVSGGIITRDDNEGKGWTLTEANSLATKHKRAE